MLKDNLPRYIYKTKTFGQILDSEQKEIDILHSDLQDLLDNTQVENSTWQLKYLEKLYGIIIDETDTLENRRARIIAKKRSVGVEFNKENIKIICSAFSGGDVEIYPHLDEDYFIIKFVGTTGVPPKIEDLYDIIEDIKPAHLDVEYEFTYNAWGDIINSFNDWQEVIDYFDSWDEVKNKPINKAEIAKRLHSIYYLDDTTNSYKRLTFK